MLRRIYNNRKLQVLQQVMKVASHFGKLFGGLLKANKAKIKHKLGASNTTPRYTYQRNVQFFKNIQKMSTAALPRIIQRRKKPTPTPTK